MEDFREQLRGEIVDPDMVYRAWLSALVGGDESSASSLAERLLDWIASGGEEPSWGGRDSRDSFILWTQGMGIDGASTLEMSNPIVRAQ